MDPMIEFDIPIQGLESGQHTFHFDISSEFFAKFENALIEEGDFEVEVLLEKRPDMIVCDFKVDGHMYTDCDRCLEPIDLPIKNEVRLLFKYAEIEREEDEIVFIPRGIHALNLGKYIYEMISLSVPLIRQYNCEEDEDAPCNDDVLDILESSAPEEPEKDDDNPIWDVLKGLKDN